MAKLTETYGMKWHRGATQDEVELAFIRNWGTMPVDSEGQFVDFIRGIETSKNENNKVEKVFGKGMEYHLNEFYKLTWPEDAEHEWTELINRELATMETLCGITGPASSGKTYSVSKFVLTLYWANYDRLTAICSTTTREALDLRIFGEIKKLWKKARRQNKKLRGNLIESMQRIVTDEKGDKDGRDFRNGILGIACKKGGKEDNISNYIGIKNRIVLLIGDELQMMNKHYISAASNLRKNEKFLFLPLGNPLDQTDALGEITEPRGGWDMYPYEFQTRVYRTKYPGGKCVRLCGLDSPNMKAEPGKKPPYPMLLSREDIEADAKYYGTQSLQYYSMSLGVLSRMGSIRRIITKQVCEINEVYNAITFGASPVKKLAALDAAYSGEGGDRCVLIMGAFGKDVDGKEVLTLLEPPILVPIDPTSRNGTAEDQIATFVRDRCQKKGITDADFYYDSTGRGSLGPALARHWGTAINPVEFGGMASKRPLPDKPGKTCRDEFLNFVSELWWFSRYCVEAAQLKGLTEEMVIEAQQREYMIVGNKKIQAEPKHKMKERTGESPDLWDALVTLIEGARQKGFNIKGQMKESERSPNKWLAQQRARVKQMTTKYSLSTK